MHNGVHVPTDGVRIVRLSHAGLSPAALRAFLRWLYTERVDIPIDEAPGLRLIAHKCHVDVLVQLIEKELKSIRFYFKSTRLDGAPPRFVISPNTCPAYARLGPQLLRLRRTAEVYERRGSAAFAKLQARRARYDARYDRVVQRGLDDMSDTLREAKLQLQGEGRLVRPGGMDGMEQVHRRQRQPWETTWGGTWGQQSSVGDADTARNGGGAGRDEVRLTRQDGAQHVMLRTSATANDCRVEYKSQSAVRVGVGALPAAGAVGDMAGTECAPSVV